MRITQSGNCRNFAFEGMRKGVRTIVEVAKDRSGTTIMAYAFLAGLIALVAVVSFDVTGTAVASMYDAISTVVIASMPKSP